MEKIEFKHKPVLLKECIEGLNIKPDGIYIDGTLGGAGHSSKIIEKLTEKGLLIGIDRDEEALKTAKNKLSKYNNIKYIYGNHDNILRIIQELEIQSVDGILLDLGVSSYQIDEKSRGFSYIENSELDMRMDVNQELTAKIVVNTYSEEKLADIIFTYGEEKYSRKIAKNIIEYRKNKQIETTLELVKIIEKSIPSFSKKERTSSKKNISSN